MGITTSSIIIAVIKVLIDMVTFQMEVVGLLVQVIIGHSVASCDSTEGGVFLSLNSMPVSGTELLWGCGSRVVHSVAYLTKESLS